MSERRRSLMSQASAVPAYIDVTFDTAFTNTAQLLTAIQTAASCTAFACKNLAASIPSEGYVFFSGSNIPMAVAGTSHGTSDVRRRSSSGASGSTSWAAACDIASGLSLRIWSLDYIT